MQRQGYKLQNYTKFEGYTCFLQGLNNGQNPVALIMKHPVYHCQHRECHISGVNNERRFLIDI